MWYRLVKVSQKSEVTTGSTFSPKHLSTRDMSQAIMSAISWSSGELCTAVQLSSLWRARCIIARFIYVCLFVQSTEGATYTFGSGVISRTSRNAGGTVSFAFPIRDLPDSRIDRAAFGLTTDLDDSRSTVSTIFRVSSGSSSDFIELQLVCLKILSRRKMFLWTKSCNDDKGFLLTI